MKPLLFPILLYAIATLLAVVLSAISTVVAITGIGMLLWVDPHTRHAMEQVMALPERLADFADTL
jgi:hypothetical protein